MKRLTAIAEAMGGMLSYSFYKNEHSYTVKFERSGFTEKSTNDSTALLNVETRLQNMFPMQYSNALNKLK